MKKSGSQLGELTIIPQFSFVVFPDMLKMYGSEGSIGTTTLTGVSRDFESG